MGKSISNILCVKTHAMGDLLMVTPAIRALKHRYPSSRITVLTGCVSAPIVVNNPYVDHVWSIDESMFMKRQIGKLFKLSFDLRSSEVDLCLCFQPALMVRLLLRFSITGRLAGLHHGQRARFLDLGTPWRLDRNRYVGHDFMDVARLVDAEPDDKGMDFIVSESGKEAVRKYLSALPHDEYAVLCPAGGTNPRDHVPQKIWPINGYVNIRDRFIAEGLSVIVTGSLGERDYCSKLEDQGTVNLTGLLSVDELGAVIQGARIVVTNDSMPLHLALALKTPVVPLFGPTRHTALIHEGALVEKKCLPVVSSEKCAPCYDNEPFPGCDRMDCITAISDTMVWNAVQQLMSGIC